jgi:phosphoinositide-3-kinase regulatory subunit 4
MGQALKAHGVSPGINGDRQEYEEMHFEASHTNLCFASYLNFVNRYRTMS